MRLGRTGGLLGLSAVLLGLSTPGFAQDFEARIREAMRRMQQQMQTVQQDKARLEAEKAALEQEKAALQKEAASAAQRAQRANAGEKKLRRELGTEVEQLRKDLAEQRKRGDELQAQLAALSTRQDQTAGELGRETENGKRLTAIVAQQREVIGRQAGMVQACNTKNLKLYELNLSILKEYQSKGMVDALLQREPLTGIKDVEIQNILQEYKEKLDAQKIETADIEP